NSGGGIANSAALHMTNCTVSGNQAVNGGGIYNDSGATLGLESCTITANRVGGIANLGLASVRNTIVAQNFRFFDQFDVSGAFESKGHNLIGVTNDSSGFGVEGDLLGGR